MDGVTNVGIHGAKFVHRVANNVHYTSQRCSANRYRDPAAEVNDLHSSDHAVRWKHRDRTNPAFAQMLLNFGNDIDRSIDLETLGNNAKCLIDRRKIVLKFDVDDRPNDLYDLADLFARSVSHLNKVLL